MPQQCGYVWFARAGGWNMEAAGVYSLPTYCISWTEVGLTKVSTVSDM